MAKQPKKPRGRPPRGDKPMVLVPTRFPEPMLDAIEALRAERLDRPDRGSIIRELVAEGLVAIAKRKSET